jgi:hypothetical protein
VGSSKGGNKKENMERRKWAGPGAGLVVVAAVACLVALSGLASASGSGYNLSFTQSANGSNANSDLIAVSSSYSSGPNLSAQFTVAGTVVTNSEDYIYEVWFGGSSDSNATAYTLFSNNTTSGYYFGETSNAGSFGQLPFTLSNGGATLSFSIATDLLPPSSSFTLNAVAIYGTETSYSYSWLGSDYGPTGNGGGGSGTCTATSCTTTPAGSSGVGSWTYIIVGVIVVVVVVALVLVLVMRKKKGTPPPPGMGQPGQPAWGAPPPPGGGGSQTWQNPPPPPPPGTG